jgi:hypothetical protein
VNVLVEELADPLFVELEIDVLLITLADRCPKLLKAPQIVLVDCRMLSASAACPAPVGPTISVCPTSATYQKVHTSSIVIILLGSG